MLANHIVLTASFRDNVQYNLVGKKAEPNPHKTEWYAVRNLITDDLEAGTRIMEATAAPSKADKCCWHFSIDWHKEEESQLDKDKALAAADSIMNKLGLEEHQAMYFWHTDADHPHLHVVVNRAHPDSCKAHDMWKSKEKLERATHEVAQEMGFMEIPGRHNGLPFDPDKEKGAPQSKEERVHTADLVPWVKEDVLSVKSTFREAYSTATSWQELTDSLKEQGLHLRSKGQGLIVSDGEKYATLSKMGKDIRLKGDDGLETKYGQTFTDFAEQEQAIEREAEEALQDWAKDADKHIEEMDVDHVDERLVQLMEAVERLEDFEKAMTVQKSAGQLMKAEAKVRRQEQLLAHAEKLLSTHNTRFDEMLTSIYKEPEAAKAKLTDLHNEGQLKKALKASRTKQPRWRRMVDNVLRRQREIAAKKGRRGSKTRKQADMLEAKLFYRMQKIREAQSRITDRKNQLTQAKADFGRKQHSHEKMREKRERLSNLKAHAAKDVTRQMIYNSNLPWRQKANLNKAWLAHQPPEKQRGRNRQKDRGQERDESGGYER